MLLGTCPRCAAPYTFSDVVGLGILRARAASAGGPVVEYRCNICGRVQTLVPHGEGRYAPPGEPAPASVPDAARRPSWARDASAPAPSPPPNVAPPPPQAARTASPPSGWDTLTPHAACELLGVSLTASAEDLERAYRTRSLGCHPDKVAHLDSELQALAERKFKRLNEAYRLLHG